MTFDDDIRRMFRDATGATSAEARATEARIRSDPEEARRLILALFALAAENPTVAAVCDLVVRAGAMMLIVEAAERDDQFALRLGALIIDGLHTLPGRTPRGKVKSA